MCTKEIPRKGAAIALNTMLLRLATRGDVYNASPIYTLYDLRSRIVHGSEHRVAAERDYEDLRKMTLEALADTVTSLQPTQIWQVAGR